MTTSTTADLLKLGLHPRELSALVTDGLYERIRHGGYTDVHAESPEERHRQLIEATRPRLGDGTVLSHVSAGVVHQLPVPRQLLTKVTGTRPKPSNGGGNQSAWLRT